MGTHRVLWQAVGLVLLTAGLVRADGPLTVPADPLAGLRAEHPRLLFTKEDARRVRSLAQREPLLARLIELNRLNAEKMLGERPVRYEIPDGKRLLAQSRYCLQRVAAMAMAYRLTGDRKFVDGALKDMTIAAGFKDWNPRHFLDTAEMTTALAIGYDWLFDALTEEQKQTIRGAIVRLGLREGLKVYSRNRWWARSTTNWNQVCNGGMVLGALAIAESEPELARQVLRAALKSIPHGVSVYADSGAYPEGPGYWQYGTSYTAVTLSAFQTALGQDFGLRKTPGLDRTGYFRIHTVGPAGLLFNYADCGMGSRPASTMFLLSRTYENPVFAWWHRQRLEEAVPKPLRPRYIDRFFPLEIAWYDPSGRRPSPRQLPLDALFRSRQDVVCMRSSWSDRNAVYVGFKAGDNRTNHGHLDIGSFVLDALGVRWALDLGSDNYNLPGYFGRQRWQYYRLTNHSHNTLVIGDAIQEPSARCEVTAFRATPSRVQAVVDMTAAYKGQARSVRRGVELVGRRVVQVRDEVVGAADVVRWGLVTAARLELHGDRAVLHQDGRVLEAVLLSPRGARFEELPTKPPTAREKQNKGTRMLAVRVRPHGDQAVVIRVVLVPGGNASRRTLAAVSERPLSSWAGSEGRSSR